MRSIDDIPTYFAEQDIPGFEPPPAPQIEMGTVGWDNESGVSDIEQDGYTLVKVQLFRGKDPSEKIKNAERAQGHRLLCMMASSIGRIPPKGTRVLIAIPHGYEGMANGTSVIIATIEKNKASQLSNQRAVQDYGTQDLVIKARSISLMDRENRFITISPESGVIIQDKTGTGAMWKGDAAAIFVSDGTFMGSVIQLVPTEITATVQGGSLLQLDKTKATMYSQNCYIQGAGVYLGLVPTNATEACFSANPPGGTPILPSPAGPGVPASTAIGVSGTVFISP